MAEERIRQNINGQTYGDRSGVPSTRRAETLGIRATAATWWLGMQSQVGQQNVIGLVMELFL